MGVIGQNKCARFQDGPKRFLTGSCVLTQDMQFISLSASGNAFICQMRRYPRWFSTMSLATGSWWNLSNGYPSENCVFLFSSLVPGFTYIFLTEFLRPD